MTRQTLVDEGLTGLLTCVYVEDMENIVITRKEAQAQGLKRYYTGKPCKHGHVAERFLSTRTCVTCHRQGGASEKGKETRRNYFKNNDEARAKKNAQCRAGFAKLWANPEYKAKKLIENRALNKKWTKENPDKSYAKTVKRRARYYGDITLLNDEEYTRLVAIYKEMQRLNKEAGCVAYHVDHIHPLSKGGTHHPDNLQILTVKENCSKGAKLVA